MYDKRNEMAVQIYTDQDDCYYRDKDYDKAFVKYTEAIFYERKNQNKTKRNKKLKLIYAKRSLVCHKLAIFKKCLEDIQCACKFQTSGDEEIFVELRILRKMLIENQMRTDPTLTLIPENSEPQIPGSSDIYEFNEDLIIDACLNSCDESFDDGNASASLSDLLDECDQTFEEETSIERVIASLSKLQIEEDATESNDKFCDIDMTCNTDSDFVSNTEF